MQYFVFNVYGCMHRKNILIYIQQEATLHILSYLENDLHVSGGTTTHHQEEKYQMLQINYNIYETTYKNRIEAAGYR